MPALYMHLLRDLLIIQESSAQSLMPSTSLMEAVLLRSSQRSPLSVAAGGDEAVTKYGT